jgi:hypothetical protein
MRARWLIVLVPMAAHAAGVELEVAPGHAWSTDITESAPVLRGRLGIEFPWFTPSVVGFSTIFSDPGPAAHQGQRGGWTGWGLAAEGRFHTNGEHRFVAALGFGWGKLTTLQVQNGDTERYEGKAAPYVEAAIGYQWARGPLRLGLEMTLDFFNRVYLMGDLGTRFCTDAFQSATVAPCPTGRTFPMIGFAATLGLAP